MCKEGRRLTVKVYPSFWIVCIMAVALGYTVPFLIMLFSVTCHEFSHVLMAKYFGLTCRQIVFTPIGEIALIENIDRKERYQKWLIVLAGPLVNLFFFSCCLLFFPKAEFFMYSNLALALFNLLPVYPLDGGRFIHYLLADWFGVLYGNKIGLKIGKVTCVLLRLLGMAQVIFFPYNISLLCMSLYLSHISQREYIQATFEFYKHIFRHTEERLLPVNVFAASKKTPIQQIVNRLSYQRYAIVHMVENGTCVANVTQEQIIAFIGEHGMNGTIEECAAHEPPL